MSSRSKWAEHLLENYAFVEYKGNRVVYLIGHPEDGGRLVTPEGEVYCVKQNIPGNWMLTGRATTKKHHSGYSYVGLKTGNVARHILVAFAYQLPNFEKLVEVDDKGNNLYELHHIHGKEEGDGVNNLVVISVEEHKKITSSARKKKIKEVNNFFIAQFDEHKKIESSNGKEEDIIKIRIINKNK
jgi:hypothetical protein